MVLYTRPLNKKFGLSRLEQNVIVEDLNDHQTATLILIFQYFSYLQAIRTYMYVCDSEGAGSMTLKNITL